MTESGRGREERKEKEPLLARLGPSARSFAPFLPQTLETQELPAEEASELSVNGFRFRREV